jgi:hypothetical protein
VIMISERQIVTDVIVEALAAVGRRPPHPHPGPYAEKFSGPYSHRTVDGGIGHNLPQEAPQAFPDDVMEVHTYWIDEYEVPRRRVRRYRRGQGCRLGCHGREGADEGIRLPGEQPMPVRVISEEVVYELIFHQRAS